MKLGTAVDHIKDALCGIANYKLGCDMNQILLDNEHVFKDYIQKEFNVDMHKRISERTPSCISHDVDFGAKMNGFESPKAYYKAAQALN